MPTGNLWEDSVTNEWVRTFTIITVPSNEMIARIHDRMPAILAVEVAEAGRAAAD